MLSNRFLPHAIDLTGTAALWINQIESMTQEQAVSLIEESTGSETDTEFVAAGNVSPSVAFVTSDLTVLSTVGYAGVPLINAGTTFTAFFRESPESALPTAIATTNHIKVVCTDGLLIPMSIRAGHNTVAKLGMYLYAILGTGGSSQATPLITTASVAITSGASQASNMYVSGPTKYTISGGSSRLVQGITDNAVDFGIQARPEGDSGEVYNTFVSIMARRPKIRFTTKDVELISEIGDGVSVSAFATYFRKLDANKQRIAPATTSHVSVSGTAGVITPDNTGLTHGQDGVSSFTYTPVKNTNTISITVGAAIPTS